MAADARPADARSAAAHCVEIRPSADADLDAIAAIYAHHVRHGSGSFEIEPPPTAEMARRRAEVLAAGWPYLVACRDGVVLGFAYANVYRPRPAYRYTAEDSIYLRPDAIGAGVGRALLGALIAACERRGARQMIAVIGDSANVASIALHAAMGFRFAGTLRASGRKFDRWVDTVLMQRALGDGDASAPPASPPVTG